MSNRDKDLGARGVENQVKGAMKEAEGKIRGGLGDATDDHSEHMKGKAKELEGKLQRNIGEAQEDLDRNT